ncbi:MAG TPA: VOC family protein [Mycobacteriales bacterium]|nr:VOC family protein [Mycobacteriales bacterium]
MPVQLNHTIVHSRDKDVAASFLVEVLGLSRPPVPLSRFLCVELDNGVTLDYADTDGRFDIQHYAFLVGEDEWGAIFDRILQRGLDHWADPGRTRAGETNTNDGGRGVYFCDPDGHLLEIITKPYGGGS